jgi:hypothetical protein
MRLLRVVSGGTEAGIQLLSGDTIELYHYSNGYTWQLVTSQLFRDVSAWYHIVVAFDTTQGTAADRVSLYVNGAKVTAFSTSSYPSQNFDGLINTTNAHAIAGSDLFFDGYLANIHFVDGQALTPSSFGFTDSNGVWQPKTYTGDYGTEDYPGATTDSSGSFYAGRGPENLFDGSTTTLCDPALQSGVITFTPTTGIPYSSSVEVYTTVDVEISLNGGAAVTTTSLGWTTIASGSGTITSLSATKSGFRVNWSAIRVDGKILVNSPNGFHLDFADTSSATALGNDVSGNNNDWTPSGLVAGPAYTANSFSTEFDGSGDYLSVPDSTDLDLGSGDFTIEAWIYSDSANTLGTIIGKRTSSAQYAPFFLRNSSTTSLELKMSNTSGTAFVLSQTASSAITSNTWHHIAVTRNGSAIKAYVDGTEVISSTFSTAVYQNTEPVVIGSTVDNHHWNGKISNLRIIKGRALYTAAFTPPSTALTAVTDTVLLTCQDSTFIDNSPSAHTITAVNDAATTTVSPFEPVDGSDAMLDSPTNYGSGDLVRGNYCTLNPLFAGTGKTFSNGNLETTQTTSNAWRVAGSTFGMSSGKWYWEGKFQAGVRCQFGLITSNENLNNYIGESSGEYGVSWHFAGAVFYNGTTATTFGSYTVGDVIGVAYDADATTNQVEFFKNGVSEGTVTISNDHVYMPAHCAYAPGDIGIVNFGQQPFKYPLAGYKSLCSTNLPTPAIADGSTAMDVALYTGTSSGAVVSTPNMSPDLVWIKDRGNTFNHQLFDTIRGANSALLPNLTSAENNYNSFTSFDSTGFTVPNVNGTGANGNNHVAWTWDAGSSTVSNTDGSITSQVRANPTAGFSIVTYTGDGSSPKTVGHELDVAPYFLIAKNRDSSTTNWQCYHIGAQSSGALQLRLNSTTNANSNVSVWNDTAPTSSVFSIGSGLNSNTEKFVAYCFAPVEGFSSFGTYVGDGSSSNGPFVYTGMRPKWIMVKNITTTGGSWVIYDTERDVDNLSTQRLAANSDAQENDGTIVSNSTTLGFDVLSNGFKLKIAGLNHNNSGDTYIYAAFAEHPFKTSRAR